MKTTADYFSRHIYRFSMMVTIICILLAVVFASAVSAATPKRAKAHTATHLTLKQIIQLVSPSIVRLTVLDKNGQAVVLGSGFVIGDDLIATNSHVIFNAHAVSANFQNGRSETIFGVMKYDFDHDLVLMRAYTHGIPSIQLEESANVQVGDPVLAIGSPEGYNGSVSTGIVSGIRIQNGTKVIQTTAPISHGSSGGALINMNGRVIGVTSFFNTDGQNLNFAYPVFFLKQMIKHQYAQVLTWKEQEDILKETVPSSPSSIPSTTNKTAANAADTVSYTTKPLSGVKEVKVGIGTLSDDLKNGGLSSDAIKNDAEIKLRKAGIPVVDQLSGTLENPGILLAIDVSSFSISDTLYADNIHISANEYVTLARAIPAKCLSITWDNTYYGTVGKDNLATLRDKISDGVDQFVNDYLAQNPVTR